MTTPKGKIVAAVPPVSRAKAAHDWDSPALLAKMTGQPVLAGENVTQSQVNSIRQYTRAPFLSAEGRIRAEMRNSHVDEHGKRVGDLYFRWEPSTTTTEE